MDTPLDQLTAALVGAALFAGVLQYRERARASFYTVIDHLDGVRVQRQLIRDKLSPILNDGGEDNDARIVAAIEATKDEPAGLYSAVNSEQPVIRK